MTRPSPEGTVYRSRPLTDPETDHRDGERQESEHQAPAPPAVPVPEPRPAEPELWSTRATTTRGMIGRPASHAAIQAAANEAARVAAVEAARAATSAQASDAAAPAVPDAAGRAPDPPRTGTVYGRQRVDRSGKVLSGRVTRLRIGWHSTTVDTLARIGVPATGAGLLAGVDQHRRGAPVRFFQPRPSRITLIGGDWAATILAFRAAALGGAIVVSTDDPARWRGLGEAATGSVVINPGTSALPVPSAWQPLLSIVDTSAPESSPERPWRTTLTLLRWLDESGVARVQGSDLVIAQCLDAAETAALAAALRLPHATVAPLRQMDDETIALLDASGQRYLRISPTEIEHGIAGPPRR